MQLEMIRQVLPSRDVTTSTSGVEVVGRDRHRYVAYLQNTHGSIIITVGTLADIAAGHGIPVIAGAIYAHHGAEPLYADAASGAPVMRVVEVQGGGNHLRTVRGESKIVTSERQTLLRKESKRLRAVVHNAGSDPITLGDAHVRVGAGLSLVAGARMILDGQAAWHAIAGGTSEIQRITLTGNPTGGAFDLIYRGHPVSVAYNADAAAIQAALRTNPYLYPDAVTVSGSGPYDVTFGAELAAKNVDAITVDNSDLQGAINEVQRITITGSPTGGNYTLTFSAQTTTNIAYNANAAAIQAALEALSNIAPGDVIVTGAGPYDVEFAQAYAGLNVAQMTATASLTGGSSPAVAITTPIPGSSPQAAITTETAGVSHSVAVKIRQERMAV